MGKRPADTWLRRQGLWNLEDGRLLLKLLARGVLLQPHCLTDTPSTHSAGWSPRVALTLWEPKDQGASEEEGQRQAGQHPVWTLHS